MTPGHYPKVNAITHRDCARIFDDPVVVQEKIDGSQFKFGIVEGKLRFWSRSREILETDNRGVTGLFGPAVAHIKSLPLERLFENVIYCGETLAKAKHNLIAYDRLPKGHVVLFDAYNLDRDQYFARGPLESLAHNIGVDIVAELFRGESDPLQLEELLNGSSQLGGILEGVVVKNYHKNIFGKIVAPQFREIKGLPPKPRKKQDGFAGLCETFANRFGGEARKHKAVQHLREAGTLVGANDDIGPLIKELMKDVEEECREEISNELWAVAWPLICKKLGPSMAQWYKEKLQRTGSASDEAGYV